MAEGVPPTYEQSLHDNQAGMAGQPPYYSEMGVSDTRKGTADEVPPVQVRNGEHTAASQASLRSTSGLTSEELAELQEKNKREQAKKYFSLREGQFEHALKECKTVLNADRDGKVINAYLLTEIDHWDHEKERIVIITEKQLVIVKYNFIGLRVDDHRKIPLIKCDKIQTGRFTYPKNTMMIPRHFQVGLRIYAGKNEKVTALQNWNPWSKQIPYITFGRHRGSEMLDRIPRYMELNYFEQEVVSAIKSAQNELHPGAADNSLEFSGDPILIEVYCGASPIVHNWGILGYGRDRGSFGF